MGDFAADTAIEPVHSVTDGRYRGRLSSDWEIWGPNGGYVAAVALRAAGVHTTFPRPVSFQAHYLSVGEFDEVDLEVVSLRQSKRAESLRVSMTQKGRPILEALVWTASDNLEGLEHDYTRPPEVPGPNELKSFEELMPDQPNRFGFWDNIEGKPPVFFERWEERPPSPDSFTWCRFRPRATFDDPFADAGRYLLLIDTYIWPAANGAYTQATESHGYMAPSLDVDARFHRLAPDSEWLLVSAVAPIAAEGFIGGTTTIWSEDRKLIASGASQLLCRPAPNPRK